MPPHYSGREFILEVSTQYYDLRDKNFLNSFGTNFSEIFYSYIFQSTDIRQNLDNKNIVYTKKVTDILRNINYPHNNIGYSFRIKNINNIQNFFLNVDNYISLNFFQHQNLMCLQNFPGPFYYVKSFYPNYNIGLVESTGVYEEKYCPQIDISQIDDLQIFTEDIFPVNALIYLSINYKNSVSTSNLVEIGFYSQANASNKLEITR